MKEIIIAIVFTILGAAAGVKLFPVLLKRLKRNNNDQNNNYMSRNNYQSQNDSYGQPQEEMSHIDESQPSPIAMIYKSEMDYISRCILDYPNIETGGQLFGFWTNDGVPVVLYAIGPGKNANHQVAFFVQDLQYLSIIGDAINAKYGLQHIGEWHSHHQLGLASPSGHDVQTIINGMKQYNKHQFLLCIGNCTDTQSTLNAFNFKKPIYSNYQHAFWVIKELESPFRSIVDKELSDVLIHPRHTLANHGRLKVVNQNESTKVKMQSEYWLSKQENNLILKQIIDYINENYNIIKTQVKLDVKGLAHLVITNAEQVVDVVFVEQFPDASPIVLETNNEGLQCDITTEMGQWDFSGDIYSSVINFLNTKFL